MRLLFTFLLLASISCFPLCAQKELKEIRAAIKAKKPADALKLVEKQRNDTSIICRSRCLYLGYEAALQISEKENERIYLQQKPDTGAYFQSLRTIFEYALLTDSAEMSELKATSQQPPHRAAIYRQLSKLFPNLAMGAQFFSRKNDWGNARTLAKQVLQAQSSPIFSERHSVGITKELLISNAEQFLFASFASGNYDDADSYVELALQDEKNRSSVLETLALICAARKDELGYRKYLEAGVAEFPNHMFFFKNLSDELLKDKDYGGVVDLSQKLATADSTNAQFPLVAAQAYDAQLKDRECIEQATRALQLDSTLYRAHLYIGRSYYRLARAIELPLSIRSTGYKQAFEQQKQYYLLAKPHLEIFRSKTPNEPNEWQPLLYEVYLKLNMGKEFEEISNIKLTNKV